MEFDAIEVRRIRLPLKHPYETSFGRIEDRNMVVLAGRADGRWYYGEASPQFAPLYQHETAATAMEVITDHIVPAVREADSVEEYDDLVARFRGNPMAKAAGDFLLHHRRSLEQDRSVAELIGAGSGAVACGAGVGLEEEPGAVVEKVADRLDEGYHRIKLKIRPGQDREYVAAVRDRFPDVPLMADANGAYTLEQADRLCALDEHDLDMIEQPLGPRDLVDHGRLADRIRTPICLDESIRSARDVDRAAHVGACEYVNLKPQRVGGLVESCRIGARCQGHGIGMWIGGLLESGIGASFALATAGLEAVTYHTDLAPSSRYFEQDLIEPELEMEDGRLEIPDGPGLYGAVDRDRLADVTADVRRPV